MKVLYTKTAQRYLDDLIDILYTENYFGFEEFAHAYVDKLMDAQHGTSSSLITRTMISIISAI